MDLKWYMKNILQKSDKRNVPRKLLEHFIFKRMKKDKNCLILFIE